MKWEFIRSNTTFFSMSLEVKHGIHKNKRTTIVFPSEKSLPQQVDFQHLQYPLILWTVLLENGMSHALFDPTSGCHGFQKCESFLQEQLSKDLVQGLIFWKHQIPMQGVIQTTYKMIKCPRKMLNINFNLYLWLQQENTEYIPTWGVGKMGCCECIG